MERETTNVKSAVNGVHATHTLTFTKGIDRVGGTLNITNVQMEGAVIVGTKKAEFL